MKCLKNLCTRIRSKNSHGKIPLLRENKILTFAHKTQESKRHLPIKIISIDVQ